MEARMQTAFLAAAVLAASSVPPVTAATPQELQAGHEAGARSADPAFAGFPAESGATFFRSRHGGEWSCASCHTSMPTAPGHHTRTGKAIEALAPAANAARLVGATNVEKWFKRNCSDVLNRPCTPQEKGDVVAFLRSLR
jgi:hypothetical protein